MSISMPLSDHSFRLETGAWPPAVRMARADKPSMERIGALEQRLNRLEAGQRTALDLVRQALDTLKETQAGQKFTHDRDVRRLAARLDACESALARLEVRQQRDDETMRERLFDLGETLDHVRATAAAAVRPGALRKLERSLGKEIDACAGALRTEFEDRIAEAVDAAESRSAQALDTLEENVWDDIIELARRFDGLADTVVKVRVERDQKDEGRAGASPFSTGAMETAAGTIPEDFTAPEDEGAAAGGRTCPGVIPFPPQPDVRAAEESESVPADVGAALCAAASRVEAEEEPEPAPDCDDGPPRAFAPLGRMVSSAGSAVLAICVMAGLSLLAGPALGPNFQGAPPAFAHDRAGWNPVAMEPEAVTLTPHLAPVLRSGNDARPWRKANRATSGH